MKCALTIFALLAWAAVLQGQSRVKARQFTTEDGLPQNSVNQILQDKDGYIWIGTQDGLARFNGYEFEVYRPDVEDSFSISDNFIIQFLEDRHGKLWINTRDGLNIFYPDSKRFYKVVNPGNEAQRQPRTLRYFGETISVQFHEEGKAYTYLIPDDIVFGNARSNIQDIGSKVPGDYDHGHNFVFPLRNGRRVTLTQDSIRLDASGTQTARAHDLELSLTGSDNWDFEIDSARLLFCQQNMLVSVDLQTLAVRAIAIPDRPLAVTGYQEKYLVGTSNGVYILDAGLDVQGKLVTYETDFRNVIIHHLLTDRENRVWIGTANLGFFLHHPNQEEFSYTVPSEIQDGLADHVWNANYGNSKLLIGLNNGLIEYDIVSESYSNLQLPGRRVKSVLMDDEGNAWAGTTDHGLYLRRKEEGQYHNVFSDATTISVLKFHNDRIWIGTYSGVFEAFPNGGKHQFKRLEGLPSSYILALYHDDDGRVWIGHNTGFSVLNPRTDAITNFPYEKGNPRSPNFNFVSGFAMVRETMYLATYGGGVSRLNPDSTFTHFTERDGLSNNILHGLAVDDNGKLWMTSNAGISRFDPETGSFTNFTDANGLASHNFSISSMDNSIPGHLMIGTTDGLLTFRPDQIQTKYPPPPFLVERVDINYQRTELHKTLDNGLTLRNADRVVAIHFAALNYANPFDVRYTYQLEGFDEQWVEVNTSQRNLLYSSLPPGDFMLYIRADSKNNLFESVLHKIPVVVLPPFWLRPIFYLPAGLLVVGLIIGIVYYFSRRKLALRVRELETKERIQQERERISRDLHDSVGTHFAYIVSRLDFLYLGWEKRPPDDKKDYLGKLADFARSGMRMLRETIWALNDENVEAISLKAKIDDYLKLCLANEEIDYRFSFECHVQSVNASVALNTFRIIQEAVSNTLKYARATKIEVGVDLGSKGLTLKVSDDGSGFDVAKGKLKSDHYGISNLEKRAQEMDSQIEIDSSETGTTILVQSRER